MICNFLLTVADYIYIVGDWGLLFKNIKLKPYICDNQVGVKITLEFCLKTYEKTSTFFKDGFIQALLRKLKTV